MLRKSILCMTIAALLSSPAFAVNAVVTDINGQDYSVMSIKLAKGSKLKVVCGDTRMEMPFKSVSAMKIVPGLIRSVDKQLYFGVEIRSNDGSVVGGFDGGNRCYVYAENGFTGKTASKAKYSSPFSNVSAVAITGKGAEKKGGKGDDDESEE
jgi:hypothetical protein